MIGFLVPLKKDWQLRSSYGVKYEMKSLLSK
jgi:hypothetical protein